VEAEWSWAYKLLGVVLQIEESVPRKTTSVVRRRMFLRWYKILVLVFQLKKFKTYDYMPSCISWGFFPSYCSFTQICDANGGTEEVAQRYVLCGVLASADSVTGISFVVVFTFHFRLISSLYQCQQRGSNMQFGDTEACSNNGVALHRTWRQWKVKPTQAQITHRRL
jgi:hypothetical protein